MRIIWVVLALLLPAWSAAAAPGPYSAATFGQSSLKAENWVAACQTELQNYETALTEDFIKSRFTQAQARKAFLDEAGALLRDELGASPGIARRDLAFHEKLANGPSPSAQIHFSTVLQFCFSRQHVAEINGAQLNAAPGQAAPTPDKAPAPSQAQAKPGAAVTQQQRDACKDTRQATQAISACTALIQAGEGLAESYTDRCAAYLNNKLYDQAVVDCGHAIAIKPNPVAYFLRGYAYAARGDYDQAIADADRSLALVRSGSAYALRGGANYNKGAKDLALTDFRKALELEPDNKMALDGLAAITASGQVAGGSNLAGQWTGQTTGNQVRQIVQSPTEIYIVAVTNNAGQSSPLSYKKASDGTYRYRFPGGQYSVLQVLGPDSERVTNPDGWTDVFKRVGP